MDKTFDSNPSGPVIKIEVICCCLFDGRRVSGREKERDLSCSDTNVVNV